MVQTFKKVPDHTPVVTYMKLFHTRWSANALLLCLSNTSNQILCNMCAPLGKYLNMKRRVDKAAQY